MTNNREMTDLEVVELYNDRGEGERLFDEMNKFPLEKDAILFSS